MFLPSLGTKVASKADMQLLEAGRGAGFQKVRPPPAAADDSVHKASIGEAPGAGVKADA